MAALDLLNPLKRLIPFAWDGPCVISSLAGLGDLFIHLPLIAALREKAMSHGIQVRIALSPGHAALGRACGWEVMEFNNSLEDLFKRPHAVRPLELLRSVRRMRTEQIALWIDLTCNALNALLIKMAGVRRLAGRTTRGGRSFTDYPLPHEAGDNEYEHCRTLGEFFGCGLQTRVFDALLLEKRIGDTLVLALSTACRWRNWPLENFLKVVRALPERRFTLIGVKDELSESDRQVFDVLRQEPNVSDRTDVLSLLEMIRLIAGCAAIVCNDTGAAHVARAYHRPGAVIYGPGSLVFWKEGSLRRFHDTSCPYYPCGQWNCHQPQHWCMEQVQADPVIAHLRAALSSVDTHGLQQMAGRSKSRVSNG